MITFILLTLLFSTNVSATETDLEQRVTKLEKEVELLKQQVDSLKSQGPNPVTPPIPTNGVPTPLTQQLTLIKWSFRPVMIKFDTYHAIDVELHNGFNKIIREIDARIDFKDLLGDHLYSVTISPDLSIPAGGTIVDQGNRRNKRLLGRGHQMVSMQVENIKAILVVEKVVFDDGTVLTF